MPQARFQFALLQLLAAATAGASQPKVCLYDPCLSKEELEVLETVGIEAIGVNEECKRAAVAGEGATLFYMPHCARDMYNNVLWANWSVDALSRVLILGNRFSSYDERHTDAELKCKANFMYLARAFVDEAAIRNIFDPEASASSPSTFKPLHVRLNRDTMATLFLRR
jgi:hypothetical protein